MFTSNKLLRGEEGFTLLETVISIAALAVLSVFILQLFAVAANANQRARDMDIASAKAMTMIESFKATEDPVGFTAELNGVPESLSSQYLSANASVFYDKDWNDITESVGVELAGTNAAYVMYIDIRNVAVDSGFLGGGDVSAGALLEADVSVTERDSAGGDARVLAAYSTSKYFAD